MAFIDDNREDVVEGCKFGVEPICTALRQAGVQIAPSSYYAAKSCQPSAKAVRDAELGLRLRVLWEANHRVYGVRNCGRPPAAKDWTSAGTRWLA